MGPTDCEVMRAAAEWLEEGVRVHLFTVVRTWSSSPCPPGSLMAVAEDGRSAGLVAGGCLEQDLVTRARQRRLPRLPTLLRYGSDAEEARRLGVPCGGAVDLVAERFDSPEEPRRLLSWMRQRQPVARRVELDTGRSELLPAGRTGPELRFDNDVMYRVFGPIWRLLIVGDGPLARLLAESAHALRYEVVICDPRIENAAAWYFPAARLEARDAATVVHELADDRRSAVVTLSCDPALDEAAYAEALRGEAFFVGALGSQRRTAERRRRLIAQGFDREQAARLRGPVGLPLGGEAPAEMALAIMAEITAVRYASPLVAERPVADRHRPARGGVTAVA